MKKFIKQYLDEVKKISESIDSDSLNVLADKILLLKKQKGRLFILGIGGSAANASHAVNDFRKILNIESYSPLDNVSELTARINDDGWDSSLVNWLKVSNFNAKDAILVFSVGGGSDTTSKNLVEAMKFAKTCSGQVFSIVSRDGGKAKILSNCCVLIPVFNDKTITPHAEEWQAIVWHMLVSCINDWEKKNEN
jgi:D-sedoheptulose 7-phosphate isomerase